MSRLAGVGPPILVCCLGLFLVACERDTPRSSGPIAPSARAGSSSEDSSDTGGITTASLTATVSVKLTEETGFVVSVESTECAAGGNTIDLASPVSEALTTDGCSLSAGTSWSFAGPHPAGTDVTFEFTSGFTAAKIRVDGSFPEWTLRFEDGTDDDFDDIVLTVRASEDRCQFFDAEISDPILQNDHVQRALHELWEQSQAKGKVELGGYIVEQDGVLRFISESSNNRNPKACVTDFDFGEIPNTATLKAMVHVHPRRPGEEVPEAPSCEGKSGIVGNGPSRPDLEVAEMSNVPQYVVDHDQVHRMPPFYRNPVFGTGDSLQSLSRNPGASCE